MKRKGGHGLSVSLVILPDVYCNYSNSTHVSLKKIRL